MDLHHLLPAGLPAHSALLHRRRRPTPLRISTRPRGAEASTIWSTIYANRCLQQVRIFRTMPLAARWGKDTAYDERDQRSVLRSVSRLLISARCITIRSHIALRWHTREAADPAPFVTRHPFVTRQMRR